MPEYNAGDAKLRIIPDASNFKKDLEARLRSVQADFAVKIELGLAQARADLQRFRQEEQRNAVEQRVSVQTIQASGQLAAWRAAQERNAVNIPVNVDSSQLRQANQALNGVNGLTGQAASGFAKMSGEIGKAVGALGQIGSTVGITALVANIPAAVTAVVSLTSAIQQLSGAALVIPGAIASAGASIGTLAIGLSGISDAYSAITAASEESGTGQADRARAASSATQSLRNAVVDEARAQEDVARARRDARQELQDLNLELRGGQISVKQAANDAAKARRDLAKGGFKDALDYNDAVLRVESSDQRWAEAISRNNELGEKANEARTKGIEGSDRVVAANEAATRATQARTNAQDALTQATSATSSAQDKATAAMAKLSPQAQEFVNTLIGLKPRWEDLRKTVSGNLLEGAGGSLTAFVDKVLPNIEGGMGRIATAWNQNINQLLTSLGSDDSQGLLDRILGNTAEAQTRFSGAIDPLVRGIGTLTAAGTDAMPRLADAVGNVAERFATFIEAADSDGRLDKWIDEGLDGFTNLGNILLNIGKSIGSIHGALGGDLLGSLERLTGKWADFLASTEGQNKLREFFAEGKREIDEMRPIIANLIQILPQIWQGAQSALQTVLPFLNLFTKALADSPALVTGVVTAFAAWRTIDGVSKLVTALTTINKLLGTDIPASATKGAAATGPPMANLAKAILPVAALVYGPQIQDWINQNVPGANLGSQIPTPGNLLIDGSRIVQGQKPVNPVLQEAVGPTAQEQAQQKRDAALARARAEGRPTPAGDDLASVYGVPGFADGGSSKAGLAVLHDGEFVLSNRANKYPMAFKQALNRGAIDPSSLPHYDGGGPYPKKPGDDLGPAGPNPTAGGIPAFFGHLQSGLSGIKAPWTTDIGGTPPMGPPSQAPGFTWSNPPTVPGQNPNFAPGGLLGGQGPGLGGPAGSPIGTPPFTPAIAPIAGSGVFPVGGALGGGPAAAPVAPGAKPPAPPAPAPKPSTPGTGSGGGGGGASSSAPPSDPSSAAYSPAAGTAHTGSGAPAGPGGDVQHLGTGAFPGEAPAPDTYPLGVPAPGLGFPGAPGASSFGGFNWKNPLIDATGAPLSAEQIYANMPDKIKPGNILMQFGTELLRGALGFFGLEGLMNSPYLGAFQTAAQYYTGEGSGSGAYDPTGGAGGPSGYDPSTGQPLAWPGSVPIPTGNPTTANVSQFLRSMSGKPYISGGTSPNGTDCSGYVSMAVNAWLGRNPFGGDRMTTRNAADWITSHGGVLGKGPPGTLQIGWYNHGSGTQDGHMAGTLPDGTNFESGGGNGGMAFGGGAQGANSSQFDMHAYFPVPGTFAPPVVIPDSSGAPMPTGVTPASSSASSASATPSAGSNIYKQWYGGGGGGGSTGPTSTTVQDALAAVRALPKPTAADGVDNTDYRKTYDAGGILRPGTTLAHNETGKDELVLTHEQASMLPHFWGGGPFSAAMIPPPPKPLPRPPDIAKKIAPPIPTPSPVAPSIPTPAPAPAPAPAPPAPAPTPAAETPAPLPAAETPQTPLPAGAQGPGGGGAAESPEGATHLHPAAKKGIESGAAALGNAANTAAAVATFGAGGLAGGGMGGLSIGGLIQQGGKIVEGLAEVGASFLVGTVDGLGGDTGNAYGATYRPAQRQPATAAGHTTNYNGGIVVQDPNELRRELNLRDSQHFQAAMANR